MKNFALLALLSIFLAWPVTAEAGCRRNSVAVTFVPTATFVAVPNNVVLLGSSTLVVNSNASAAVASSGGAAASASSGGGAAAASGGGRRGVSRAFSFTGIFGTSFSRSVSR